MITGNYTITKPQPQPTFKGQYIPNVFSTYTNKYLKTCSKDAFSRFVENIPEVLEQVREINIPVSRGHNISAWDINPNNSKNYVLFLHGMAMNVSNYQKLYKSLMDKVGIFAVEYRGYGKAYGQQTTEKTLCKDVKKAYKYLVREKGVNPENIILIGSCMGGALAVNLAKSEKNIKSLILIAPLTSINALTNKFIKFKDVRKGMPDFIKKLIANNKFFKWLYGKQFDTLRKIKSIKNTDIYLIQSRKDAITRIGGARLLANKSRQNGTLKEFCLLETGGHKMDQEKIIVIERMLNDILANLNKN